MVFKLINHAENNPYNSPANIKLGMCSLSYPRKISNVD